MPNKIYTPAELDTLNRFSPIENFKTRSLSFVNVKQNIVIDDAIRITENGDVIFKDTEIETTLKELITSSRGIEEEFDDQGNVTLFFVDDKNRRVSLGRIYELLFKENVVNGVFWFGERSSEFLSDEMDEYIVKEFYEKRKDESIDPRSLNILFEETDNYKNIWFDVPCIEVITPEYVDNKYASISAKVCFKVKCELSTITAFRIYDATVGLELSRNVQIVRSSADNYISYTVPITYQGPLPDSIQESEGVCRSVTIDDLQNTQFENGEEKGIAISRGDKGYVPLPNTKHIIKLQWATCSSTIELDTIGNPVGEFNRRYDPKGETSLDVVVYDKNSTFNIDKFFTISGSIDTQTGSKNTKQIFFKDQESKIDVTKDYNVKLSTNKNFETWIESKTAEGFIVGWNRSVRNGIIDWIVTQENVTTDNELIRLNDENRGLNHDLFGSKEVDADFCGEVISPPPEIDFFIRDDEDIPIEETCECCNCCEDLSGEDLELNFTAWGGSDVEPEGGTYYEAEGDDNYRYSIDPELLRYEAYADQDESDKCLIVVLGSERYEAKVTVNVNDLENPKQFISLSSLGISLESESEEGTTKYQKYNVGVYTMRSTDDVWVEDTNQNGILIQWDPDPEFAPKRGIIYLEIYKSKFVSPQESVAVGVIPKKRYCFETTNLINSSDDTLNDILP